MFLHESKDLFTEVTYTVSKFYNVDVSVVVKDYFVTMLLKQIARNNPDVLFKGGTSLSKGYGVIKRFSEDIDLNAIPSNPLTESKRREFNMGIISAFNSLGLIPNNGDIIRTRSDFVAFVADIPNIGKEVFFLTPYIKVESVLRRKGRVLTCRYETRVITSYIYDYLIKTQGNSAIAFIKEFDLDGFPIYVQDLRYTLCEKLIAIGNNYLRGKSDRLSRHIYDVKKLLDFIPVDVELRRIFLEVVNYTRERNFDDALLGSNNLETCIYKALTEDFYKSDYEAISKHFIFDSVSYEECKCKLLYKLIYNGFGICDTVSQYEGLRDIFVGIPKGLIGNFNVVVKLQNGKYSVVGTNQVLGREYLVKNSARLINKKVSSDGRLIDRFKEV